MDHVWWRTHLRKLPELASLGRLGNFSEVDELMPFLTEVLDLPANGKVLDLGCARGSFSIRMAQWGFQVTAVDESAPLLEHARQAAAQREVEPEFRLGNVRSLPERSVFDGALILDFGTLPDADNAAMMRAAAAALKPGGKLVFATCNPYYWCRENSTQHQAMEGMDLIRKFQFNFRTGAVTTRLRLILPNGERKAVPPATFRAYTLPELDALTDATGLADLKVYGEDESGLPQPGKPLDVLCTPFFYCVALRPVTGESGEGI